MTDTTNVINVGTPNSSKGKIAAALALFQANVPKIVKDSAVDAGRMKYNFAPLEKLVEVIYPLLAAQEIAYVAVPEWNELGFGLKAGLYHSSGEFFEGFYPLGAPNNPAQAIGSAISYARRYALLSLTGVAPVGEDDDGASATQSQAAANEAAPARAQAATKETPATIRAEMGETIENSGGLVTTADANTIMKKVTGDKPIPEWSLADMKKARTELNKLLSERKAGS